MSDTPPASLNLEIDASTMAYSTPLSNSEKHKRLLAFLLSTSSATGSHYPQNLDTSGTSSPSFSFWLWTYS
ncbi:hypothetical protein P9112_004150 [Eukaryota sp. TZLM1-RC]